MGGGTSLTPISLGSPPLVPLCSPRHSQRWLSRPKRFSDECDLCIRFFMRPGNCSNKTR